MSPSPDSFEIIRAALEHASLVAGLFDSYRQFYHQPPDLEGARRFIAERLRGDESVIFLALDGQASAPRALAFVQLYPAFSSVSMKPLWILNDLYVVPEARKRGVGRALMESTRQLAISTGSKGLILETAKDNLAARRLYEGLGYERDEEFYRYALYLPSNH